MPGGIFCIENWDRELSARRSVRPLLEFLRDSGGARIIHQRVSTPRELHHYLALFAAARDYRIGYVAMHGNPGQVRVGRHELTLDSLAKWTRLDQEEVPTSDDLDDENWNVDLEQKVLYLGSCATLRVTQSRLEAFRSATGARLVCGFTKYVDWFASGAFDVMLLSALAQATERQPMLIANAVKRLRREAGDLCDTLGFVTAPDHRP